MNRGLFLDRDGVVNVDYGYVYRIVDFEFISGIFELTSYCQKIGFKLFVITNQSGIGRGYYAESDFDILSKWMLGKFSEKGVVLDEVYFCPNHPVHGQGKYRKEDSRRKPNPGMLLEAIEDYNINPGESFLIGDKMSDLEAGLNAGIGCNLFLTDKVCENSLPENCFAMADLHKALYFIQGRE